MDDGLDDVPVSLSVSVAFQKATGMVGTGAPIGSATLLHALAAIDHGGEWDRLMLPERPLGLTDPDQRPATTWRGHLVTATCVAALRTACHIAKRYGLHPVPAGVLAFALVADPDSAAARTLTVLGTPRSDLLAEIQGSILGADLRGIDRVLAECLAASSALEDSAGPAHAPAEDDDRASPWNVLAYPADTLLLLLVLGMALLSLTLFAGNLTAASPSLIGSCARAAPEAGRTVDIEVDGRAIPLNASWES